jgi:subtilisin family serine protease
MGSLKIWSVSRSFLVLAVGLMFMSFSLYPLAQAKADIVKEPASVPGELIIKLRAHAVADQAFVAAYKLKRIESLLGQQRGDGPAQQAAEKLGLDRLYLAHLSSDVNRKAVQQAISQDPRVEYAEPNYIVSASLIPNDPDFSRLWGLENTGQTGGNADADIDAPEAWDIMHDTAVTIGVIDTGVSYTHEDLSANVWTNPGEVAGNNLDDDGNGFIDDIHGWDFANNDNDPLDDNGHGTHVSGTIAGIGNNGVGVSGVAWSAKVAALKFLDSTGSGNTANAVKAVQYANQMGFAITSNSWGGGGFSQALYDAIATGNTAGTIFVAAAGNSNLDNDAYPNYPSNYNLPNIVAVAATDHRDTRASFSNYGATTVDIAAPGVGIYSTVPTGNCDLCDASGYASLSGTSMATPHVAGALALLKVQFPDAGPSALIYQLLGNVDEISSLKSLVFSGGRLNLLKALTLAPKPIASLKALPEAGAPALTVTFTDNSLGTITSRTLDFGDGSAPATLPANGSLTHTYANVETYTATVTVSGSNGTSTNSRVITVANNYTFAADTFNWVDTTSFNTVTLSDDSAALVQLPFSFTLYGQSYTTAFIGSNGLLTLGNSSGATAFTNTAIPSAAAPNAAIYPYWDDLNPAIAGQIRYGTASDGSFIASWEGVPTFSDASATLTFQIALLANGDIKMQYQDVKPANTSVGAGRSATIGIENSNGLLASQYGFNGSQLLGNNQAIRFTSASAPSNRAPVAVIGGPYSGTENQSVNFNASASNDPDNNSLSYRWNFGDGATLNSSTPFVSHTYTRGGTYTVALVVNDGQLDSATVTTSAAITDVNDPPVANAGPDKTAVRSDTVAFDASASTDEEGPVAIYAWNFGDGATATGKTTSHIYNGAGSFMATLTITDSGGLTAQDTAVVTVTNDTVTVTKADYTTSKKQLVLEAKSSRNGKAVLTAINIGTMQYVVNRGVYQLTVNGIANPGTVTITSSLGGAGTKTVSLKGK